MGNSAFKLTDERFSSKLHKEINNCHISYRHGFHSHIDTRRMLLATDWNYNFSALTNVKQPQRMWRARRRFTNLYCFLVSYLPALVSRILVASTRTIFTNRIKLSWGRERQRKKALIWEIALSRSVIANWIPLLHNPLDSSHCEAHLLNVPFSYLLKTLIHLHFPRSVGAQRKRHGSALAFHGSRDTVMEFSLYVSIKDWLWCFSSNVLGEIQTDRDDNC